MKKIIATVLAMVMALALCATAFADIAWTGYNNKGKELAKDYSCTAVKATAEKNAPKVYSMIDKLAKIGLIHKNKASNLKSGIAVYINKLA